MSSLHPRWTAEERLVLSDWRPAALGLGPALAADPRDGNGGEAGEAVATGVGLERHNLRDFYTVAK